MASSLSWRSARRALSGRRRHLRRRRHGDGPRIAVIGAGAGGLATAVKLKLAGFDNFTIYERSDGVGGVWRSNTYPGAACDVMSHFYSFSFLPHPNWSRTFATQTEILAYFERCVTEFALAPHLRTNTEIVAADWDASAGQWTLTSAAGDRFQAHVLVSALGLFSEPKVPELNGLEEFAGDVFHSGKWRHDIDLQGRRVAVVGTGPSAIQFVPEIAPLVDQLHVFQREPGWLIPKPDRPYSEREKWVFAHVPFAARIHRWKIFLKMERVFLARPEGPKREAKEAVAIANLERQVPDDDLRARLLPNYPIGCKRTLLSNNYLPALTRANVELVSGAVREVTAKGVVGPDGIERSVDCIIFATGFKATDYLSSMSVTGVGGRTLASEWESGARAHLGITVPHFPNLFILYGPNTNALTSLIFILERQAAYVVQAVRRIARGGRAIAVRPLVADQFAREIQRDLEGTVWLGGCSTYFRDEHGHVTTQWPHRGSRYWMRTRVLRSRDFEWATPSR